MHDCYPDQTSLFKDELPESERGLSRRLIGVLVEKQLPD
jgi:hypothetical protein